MRLHFLTSAILCSFILVSMPAPAQANWIEFFFPMLKDTSDDPSNTLRAPFAEKLEGEEVETGEGADGTAKVNAQSQSTLTVPLHLSHRSDREIAQWVTTAVSEAITFEDADYKAEMDEHKKIFDDKGWEQLQIFLADTNMIKVIESDRYQMRSYVRGIPILLNEGAVSKRYRWLYEVTANISYLERNVSDYKDVEPQNRTVKVIVQIGRTKDADNEQGLLIERWDGKVVKTEE